LQSISKVGIANPLWLSIHCPHLLFRHSENMIERLERAGLGYRVRADETHDMFGK
jgi:hypothetical protein